MSANQTAASRRSRPPTRDSSAPLVGRCEDMSAKLAAPPDPVRSPLESSADSHGRAAGVVGRSKRPGFGGARREDSEAYDLYAAGRREERNAEDGPLSAP